jgi:2-C-methyl-D-erythritol 4-phosphate cytidylyltransferase
MPQTFLLPAISHVHEQAALSGSFNTDDTALFEQNGLPVRVVEGEPKNMKLTYHSDSAELCMNPGPSTT